MNYFVFLRNPLLGVDPVKSSIYVFTSYYSLLRKSRKIKIVHTESQSSQPTQSENTRTYEENEEIALPLLSAAYEMTYGANLLTKKLARLTKKFRVSISPGFKTGPTLADCYAAGPFCLGGLETEGA